MQGVQDCISSSASLKFIIKIPLEVLNFVQFESRNGYNYLILIYIIEHTILDCMNVGYGFFGGIFPIKFNFTDST